MTKLTKIDASRPTIKSKLKVAAYARVSLESERLSNSLANQISYYNRLIQSNPEWEFVGVYADKGISGTQINKRMEFQRMIQDAEAGKIDVILTKSIQRFARNTVDLLETVRHLKEIGVEVRFERENINSFSGDGELMLTVLASFAQQESLSISENVKWGKHRQYAKGIPNSQFQIYGYRWINNQLTLLPEEAEVVKFVFDDFIKYKSINHVMNELNRRGIKSLRGKSFSWDTLKYMLTNVTYTGDLVLQKIFTVDPITKVKQINEGQLPQYVVEDNHQAVVTKEEFAKAQEIFEELKTIDDKRHKDLDSPLKGKIICGICGREYKHIRQKQKDGSYSYFWHCDKCHKYQVLDKAIESIKGNHTDDEIKQILVTGRYEFEVTLTDGSVYKQKYSNPDIKWSDERKQRFSDNNKGVCRNKAQRTTFSGYVYCNSGQHYMYKHNYVRADGSIRVSFYCPNPGKCGNFNKIEEDTLKSLVVEVLDLEEFDEEVFHKEVERIDLEDTNQAHFHLIDGREVIKKYERSTYVGKKNKDN